MCSKFMQNIYRTYREGKIIKDVRGITTVNFIQISSLAAAVCIFFNHIKNSHFVKLFALELKEKRLNYFEDSNCHYLIPI